MALNPKQRAFVEAYVGNATDAARKAGYTGTSHALEVTGSRLLRHAEVAAAIEARRAKASDGRIASREERQAFWSEVLRTHDDIHARLRASELLGKSEADFTEKHEHKGGLSIGLVNPYAKGDE